MAEKNHGNGACNYAKKNAKERGQQCAIDMQLSHLWRICVLREILTVSKNQDRMCVSRESDTVLQGKIARCARNLQKP